MARPLLTLLVDSDIVAYAFAAKSERSYDWGDGEVTRVSDELDAVTERTREWMDNLKRDRKADDMIVCLSDPARNFRKDVLPTYKHNRRAVVKPEHLFPIKQWLADNYRSFQRPGLEADDVMGILATHPTIVPGVKEIVSIDKDMAQIPGRLHNPVKKTTRVVTAEEGERLHWMQMLTGDQVDGYAGCPGIGPKRAEAVLADAEVLGSKWAAVVAAYEQKGLTEADALVQARVSKILQHTDYDFKRKEPILWTPPTA